MKYKIILSVEEKEFINAEIIGKETEKISDKASHIHYKIETYLVINVADEPSIIKKYDSIVKFIEHTAGRDIGMYLRKNDIMVTDLCKERFKIQGKLLEILREELEKYKVEIETLFISSVDIMDKNIIKELGLKIINEMNDKNECKA